LGSDRAEISPELTIWPHQPM